MIRDLYYQAQCTYKKLYGQSHSSFPRRVPKRTSDLGYFLANADQFDSGTNDTLQTAMLRVENQWKPLVDELGDSLVAYELAKSWANSELECAEEKAKYWYEKYEKLAPSLPYGDLTY